jgi:polyhydroxybutyrate depolymerase
MMAVVSGLSRTADREGFLVAYPNGTGRGSFLHWNVGALPRDDADDVGYLGKVLDDIEASAKVDTKRVYAVGYSNGGMMCYRLASALPGRIAAIASVAGTMTASKAEAKRPVSVLHFHGTKDTMVPFDGSAGRANGPFRLRSVDESVRAWAEADGCPKEPQMAEIPAKNADALAVRRLTFGPGREGSEVVLYVIEGGGHTWPGKPTVGPLLGKSAVDLKANDLIWEFFKKHPIP